MEHIFKPGDRVIVRDKRVGEKIWLWAGVKGEFIEYRSAHEYFKPDKGSVYSDGVPLKSEYISFEAGMSKGDLLPDQSFTASLGPVRVDPQSQANRARQVREAMKEASKIDNKFSFALHIASINASDEALCKLWNLLR